MIKQINLITLFLCAGQEGPFSLISPFALLYYLHIYYLLSTIYCIYSQLDCVGLRPLPGVHTLLPEHLAVSVASQVLQGNPSCHHHHHHCDHHHQHHHHCQYNIIPHLSWSCSRLPLRHSALGVHCSCWDTILEWRHDNTTHFFCLIMSLPLPVLENTKEEMPRWLSLRTADTFI